MSNKKTEIVAKSSTEMLKDNCLSTGIDMEDMIAVHAHVLAGLSALGEGLTLNQNDREFILVATDLALSSVCQHLRRRHLN